MQCHRRCRVLPGDRFTRQNAEAFYQKGPCSLLLVIALVRPIVDCDHFLLVIFLTKNYSKGVEQDTSPEKEQNVICTKYAPMRLQPRANKWQKCGTRILNSFRKCIRDLLRYILELLYYFLQPKTAKLILHRIFRYRESEWASHLVYRLKFLLV